MKKRIAIAAASAMLAGCAALKTPLSAQLKDAVAAYMQQQKPEGCQQPQPPQWERSCVDFSELEWVYGGFDGGAAQPVAGCEISGLKVTERGMSYQWIAGGCHLLGAPENDAHNASYTLACLFCYIEGRWVGGKFDWISTDRSTRGFENIEGGYKGWDTEAIRKAEAFAFVIVSKDGKRRSNAITVEVNGGN